MASEAEELFQAREKRVIDAMALKFPDRVPVMVISGFYPAFHYGINCREAMYEPDKAIAAWSKFVIEFEPDMIDGPFATRVIGGPLETLDYRQLKWAGHGLGDNESYQFVEGEYMTGTPDEVKGYCKKLIDIVGKDGGFIMDASTVVDGARPENLKAMFQFTKEYGVYQ